MKTTIYELRKNAIPFLLCGMLFNTQMAAQTNISGYISSNTTWTISGSPYLITGNTILDSGIVLTINPGATIKLDSGTSFLINGILRAIGTASSRITFTSSKSVPVPGSWDHITFSGDATGYNYSNSTGSIMEYCVVEYGGGSTTTISNATIRIREVFPFINFCEIRNNASGGITYMEGSNPQGYLIKVTNCYIHDNDASAPHNFGVGGLWIDAMSGFEISNNVIQNNAGSTGGIGCGVNTNNITGQVVNNIITGNRAIHGGGGIVMTRGVNFSFNLVYGNSANEAAALICQLGGNYVIANNLFIGNSTWGQGGVITLPLTATVTGNMLIDNSSPNAILILNGYGGNSTVRFNTMSRNRLSGGSQTGTIDISDDGHPVISNNNIFNNLVNYDIYMQHSNLSLATNAENSWWNTTSASAINGRIYDFLDLNTLAAVDYSPFAATPDTLAPVTPPLNVIKRDIGGGKIRINWTSNQESDLAGYKIYWGSPTGYSFSNSKTLGQVNADTLSGLSITDTIAITAIDAQANGIADQLEGHESWFTKAVGIPVLSVNSNKIKVCAGDTVTFMGVAADVDQWQWTFSGGNISASADQNPQVIYSTAGTFNVSLIAVNLAGSDTVILSNYITVNVMPAITLSSFSGSCSNDSAFLLTGGSPSGGIYSGTGITGGYFNPGTAGQGVHDIKYVFADSNGCGIDSVTQPLAVEQAYSFQIPAAICKGDIYSFPDGSTGIKDTVHTSNLFSISGCDSTIITTLIVNPSYSFQQSAAICEGGIYYFPDGSYATKDTVNFSTLHTSQGCDSNITTSLKVNHAYQINESVTICQGETYTFPDGTKGSTFMFHTSNLKTTAGCDSSITTTLSVTQLDTSVSVSLSVMTANASGAAYQWVDCTNGNNIISGQTFQTFSPVVNGSYAVIVTANNCSDTSSCYIIIMSGISENVFEGRVKLYPNPVNERLHIQVETVNTGLFISLMDISGRQLISVSTPEGAGIVSMDTRNLNPGLYIVKVSDEAGRAAFYKLLK